ncbi:3',5'-cyclic-nucleotide phosphodiesterase [Hydrogenovibrio sp. JE_KL2]|uniref:3',5'-cyclic-nucleotide phosphodiesterase n=1 Tax=Hydrogenovibrio sp. JE_KL2 TaxID=2651188 RepID=UPI00128CBF52|nr:3',5'-cyclic-nucleotide phosphodiesterase [Hydrogenovibrio sp. JE_KL2]MPQ77209.1 3',5'-cyclic-nucleotide phosphodiesterase [Hydrogenovibrio sp. JE_KL2]
MKLTILGASGGISPESGTTSFLLGESILIDAGTGSSRLTHQQMHNIRYVLLTHSHLDHICNLPFLLNTIIGEMKHTVEVFALQHTIDALKNHIFNGVIWPDFSKIPSKEKPALRFKTIEVGDALKLDGLDIQVLPAEHTVPTVGFRVSDQSGSFAFTGDCARNDLFWQALNQYSPVDLLIVDDQYLACESVISEAAKHYYPQSLSEDLAKLNGQPRLYLTHLPPFKKEKVMSEAEAILSDWQPKALTEGMVLEFPLQS